MAPVPNPTIIFGERYAGSGYPEAGKHIILDKSKTIDIDNVPLNGGYLTKTLVVSVEPYLLERMKALGKNIQSSYITHYTLNAPLCGFALVKVLRSEDPNVKVGDYLYGNTAWQEYTVQPYVEGRLEEFIEEEWVSGTFDIDRAEVYQLQVVPDPKGAYPLTAYMTAMGIPGLTGWLGLNVLLGETATAGKTIYISSGASGVGSMVIQLAKRRGMTVIASASTPERLEYMRSLGADYVFNYKTEGYDKPLREAPDFDIVWDNVGGKVLEYALKYVQAYGTILCCGGSSEYDVPYDKRYGITNSAQIFRKRLNIRGFIISEPKLVEHIPRFVQEMPQLVLKGEVKTKEYLLHGWEAVADAFRIMLSGEFDGVGKPLVVVDEEGLAGLSKD